jgi:hypothetical protein
MFNCVHSDRFASVVSCVVGIVASRQWAMIQPQIQAEPGSWYLVMCMSYAMHPDLHNCAYGLAGLIATPPGRAHGSMGVCVCLQRAIDAQ